LYQAFALNSFAWATGGIVSTTPSVFCQLLTNKDQKIGPVIGGLLAHPAERFPTIFGDNAFLKIYPYFLHCAVPATYSACAWICAYLYLKETVKKPTSLRKLIFKSGSTQASHDETTNKPLPLKSLLVFRVIIAGSNYAFVSLVDISFRAIQPLFLSTPIELGGLGLSPFTIGTILSVFGVLNGFCQIFFFPSIHKRGARRKFL
jgi:hypothetical protein